MTGRVKIGKLLRISEINATGQVGTHLRAEFRLEPAKKLPAAKIRVHRDIHAVIHAATVPDTDDEHAAGDDAAEGPAGADAAAETGGRLEHEVVFQIEQLLPRAD